MLLDDCDELIPESLSMVKNIVDSENLTMNISRDTLQHSRALCMIKRNPVKKYLEMLAETAENKDNYNKFDDQLRKYLKLSYYKDHMNNIQTAQL
eukprot:8281635-Heterocapsa_arctica.AAC.1